MVAMHSTGAVRCRPSRYRKASLLSIIALIAVPIVLNMISNAKKKAAEDSAYGYIGAINYNIDLASMNSDYDLGYTSYPDGEYKVQQLRNIKMKGKKPTGGTVTITNGKVTSANDLCFDGYPVDYDGKEASIDSNATCGSSSNGGSSSYSAYSSGDSVTLNDETVWVVVDDSSTSESNVTLVAVKNIKNSSNIGTNTGSNMFCENQGDPSICAIAFDTNNSNVYANSSIRTYLEGTVKNRLEASLSTTILSIKLLDQSTLETLGCTVSINPGDASTISCSAADPFMGMPWTSVIYAANNNNADTLFGINNGTGNGGITPAQTMPFGARPVITVSKSVISIVSDYCIFKM